MTDLYEVLGVDRTASSEAVRRAYRQKAKVEHPDKGGSPERFALISLAADVLSDDERRARYDETGKADDAPADLQEAQARELAVQAVVQAIMDAEKEGRAPHKVDLIAKAAKSLNARTKQLAETKKNHELGVVRLERVVARLHAKGDKPNIITPSLNFQTDQLRKGIEQLDDQLAVTAMALVLLKDHEFDAEPDPMAAAQGMSHWDKLKAIHDPGY